MDVQAALRDGYSKDEVMAELGKRTGMNYQQALKDGHSADDVLSELTKRDSAGSDTRTVGNPNASKAETERLRREFVAKEGTAGTRVKDYFTAQTPPAEDVGDFVGRVLPESAGRLPGRILHAGYEAIKGQTDPIIKAAYGEGNRPGQEMLSNAGKTVSGLAQAMTAPTGLMGLDKAQEAWLSDPAGSALAVSPIVKPSLRTLGSVADTATLAPRAVLADAARGAANKLTDMTLKQSTTLKPAVREQNVRVAHEGGFLPNSKGVANLNEAISSTEAALKEGIANGDAAQVKGTLDKAKTNVEALREKANRSSDPEANNKLIDGEIDRLNNHPLLDQNGQIDIGTLQKMKVEQGREIQKTYGEQKPQFQNEIDKSRVRGLKEELESALDTSFPELSATNKKLGEYYSLKKSLDRAANRIENREGIGFSPIIKSGAGAGLGSILGPTGAAVGGGIGTAIAVIEHPSVAPRLAQMLYKASKGTMTYPEALKTVKKRIADMSFIGNERGLVGLDINAQPEPYNKTVYRGVAERDPLHSGGMGKGTYYTSSLEHAKSYAEDFSDKPGHVIKQEVSLSKPFYADTLDDVFRLVDQDKYNRPEISLDKQGEMIQQDITNLLTTKGYDGIVLRKSLNPRTGDYANVDEIVVFPKNGSAPRHGLMDSPLYKQTVENLRKRDRGPEERFSDLRQEATLNDASVPAYAKSLLSQPNSALSYLYKQTIENLGKRDRGPAERLRDIMREK